MTRTFALVAGLVPSILGCRLATQEIGVVHDDDPDDPTTTTADDGIRLDAAAPGRERGCTKVDFLFVIDDSGSMADEQINLALSVPGFLDDIERQIESDDLHIMVVDSDGSPELGPLGCDDLLGAGHVRRGDGVLCPVVDGRRYLLGDTSELDRAFACIASVGIAGSPDENVMGAILRATGPELNAPTACNAGFLRDDAVLVVVFVTDEDDAASGLEAGLETPTPGTPRDWYEQLVAHKRGDPNAVVVLGLTGDGGPENGGICPALLGITGAEPAPRLSEFVGHFENGMLGPVCSFDYSVFFSAAIGLIDSACTTFVPNR